MAKTRRNKNKRNDKQLNVYCVSTGAILIVIGLFLFFGAGILVRHGNNSLENKIKQAEIQHAKLESILRSESANLNSKQNIAEIQRSLSVHHVAMNPLRRVQCHVFCLNNQRVPTHSEQTAVAYNNN